MTRDEAATMTQDQAKALPKEQLDRGLLPTATMAKSSNVVSRITIDLFDVAVHVWETVRDGTYDATKNYVGIVVDPETYLTIAIIGAAMRQGAKANDAPSEETRAAVAVAVEDIMYANARGHTGPSHMQWGGVHIFVDPRVQYLGVGVFTKPDDQPAQVFDAVEFADLQHDFAKVLEGDAQVALIEKMDAMGTVPGQVGRA